MFQLVELSHMVQVHPWLFGKSLNDAVIEQLNCKLSNKVVLDVGLCLALLDLVSLGDSYIFPGDGSSHTKATFRYVVFRPFMEEIIEGNIKSSNEDGIQVTLGFFEDIFIKKDSMMADSHYDETDKVWVWDYKTDDSVHELFMDVGEKIRFRIIAEQFNDTTVSDPDGSKANLTEENKQVLAPYLIYGAINDQGLGLTSWWANNDPGDEEDDEVAEEEQENEEEIEEGNGDIEDPSVMNGL